MPDLNLDHHGLQAWLPHRGANLFIDHVWANAERTQATSRTTIPLNDPRGRELLLRQDGSGRRCWSEPLLLELMALSGIVLLHEKLALNHQVSVFSMVSRVAYHYLPGVGEEVVGYASLERSRSGFTIFSTRAEAAGKTVLEAEVMSGGAIMADIARQVARPFAQVPAGTPVDPRLFAWKPAHLRGIDAVVSADAATRTLVCSYVYPPSHPFVAGHFPEAPLMMGVMQWNACCDCAWAARAHFGMTGPIVAQCRILRDSGKEVLDVRELVIAEVDGVPMIRSTKRLAFRDVVRPTDGLLIEAVIAPAPAG